ncbi:hypothetical protein BDE18_2297 [Paracoccus pantotrophus]|uniref:Uncharacterized protein n=1 Tax=Paracoccus pantotrophus TaxID=82367 RepID=A0AAE6NU62_PARPN|nr:hypothetical protein [Paracoccus pantotrophus]QFG34908.1 hypothetical protein ESD82_01465 [Paracoccus pantotrophus]RKS43500.1 hypothetical protein BDE18_2297 [Paracoccus pantotrophus]
MSQNKDPGIKSKKGAGRNDLDSLEIKPIRITTSRRQAVRNILLLILAYASGMGLLYWLLR